MFKLKKYFIGLLILGGLTQSIIWFPFGKNLNSGAQGELERYLEEEPLFEDVEKYSSINIVGSYITKLEMCDEVGNVKCNEVTYLLSYEYGRPSVFCNRSTRLVTFTINDVRKVISYKSSSGHTCL